MISDSELKELERQAIEAEKLIGARERYQAALQERQQTEAREKLETEITRYTDILDSKSSQFQASLSDVSGQLKSLLEQLYTLEVEFSNLNKERDDLLKAAGWLARLRTERGDYDATVRFYQFTREEALKDDDFLSGIRFEEVKRRFRNGLPLVFDISGLKLGALAQSLLSSEFFVNIGLMVTEQRQQAAEPQPEIIQPIKQNGVAPKPLETNGKLIPVEQFQKLWTSPPR